MGNGESKTKKKTVLAPVPAPVVKRVERVEIPQEVMRIYGLDKEARIPTPNTMTNIKSKAILIVKQYIKKKKSPIDPKQTTACVTMMARSVVDQVLQYQYNRDYLSCIVLACFILVISKTEQINDVDIIDQMGETCGVDRVRAMVQDIKKRQFEPTAACRILA